MLNVLKKWPPLFSEVSYLPALASRLDDGQRIVEVGSGYGRHLPAVADQLLDRYVGLEIGYRTDFSKQINPALKFIRCQLKAWQISDALTRFNAGALVIRLDDNTDITAKSVVEFVARATELGVPAWLVNGAHAAAVDDVVGHLISRGYSIVAEPGSRVMAIVTSEAAKQGDDDRFNDAVETPDGEWPDVEGIFADYSIPAYLSGRFIPAPEALVKEPDHILSDEGTAAAILEAKAARRPWSMVRLGNGEARVIGHPDYVSPIWLSRSLRNWFGDRSADGSWQEIRRRLMGAIVASDLVGVPAGHGPDAHWGLADRMLRLYNCMPHTGELCRHGFHIHAMRIRFYEALIENETAVGLISPHDLRDQLKGRFAIGDVTWHAIPGQAKFFKDRHEAKHYPDVFLAMREAIKPAFPGQIYLVGAGPLGKVYCQWVKEAGGIGLDVGSILDVWAGYATRSGFEGLIEKFSLEPDSSDRQPMLRKA